MEKVLLACSLVMLSAMVLACDMAQRVSVSPKGAALAKAYAEMGGAAVTVTR